MKVIKRKEFREYFQPSKIMLGVFPMGDGEYNIITLCFTTTCSYKPPMIALSIEDRNFSYELARKCNEMVLAIPGEKIAEETMKCGCYSGRDVDKFLLCNFNKQIMNKVSIPGIKEAIANLELKIVNKIKSGDHITLFAEVLSYNLNEKNIEKNLISIGPNISGYKVIIKKGMHRIGVIDTN